MKNNNEIATESTAGEKHVDALVDQAWEDRSGQSERILALATDAIERAKQIGYEAGVARATVCIAVAHFHAGRWRDARLAGRSVTSLIPADDSEWRYRLVTVLAAVAMQLDDVEQSGPLLLQSLAIAKELGDARKLAIAHGNIAAYYFFQSLYERSLQHAQVAIECYTELEDWTGVSRGLKTVGDVYKNLGRTREAFENYNRSVDAARRGGNELDIAAKLVALAIFEIDFGLYREAVRHTDEAHDIFFRLGNDYHIGQTLSTASTIYAQLHDLPKALELRRQALDAHRRVGYSRMECEHLYNIASILAELGQYDEAIATHESAIAIAEDRGEEPASARALASFGDTLRRVGRLDDATVHLQRAVEILIRIGDVRAVASKIKLAEVYIDRSLANEAIEILSRANEALTETQLPLRSNVARLLALAHRLRGE
ncbi:MAG: tetratricopeptide repeat protein, partial [bacterium]|nr:tetratricopeptide repeat protein [Candidatus Kapabacteria bacterium]